MRILRSNLNVSGEKFHETNDDFCSAKHRIESRISASYGSSNRAISRDKFNSKHIRTLDSIAHSSLGEDLYLEIAKELKLDLQRFEDDRQSAAAKAALQNDEALGKQMQVNGTPYFFLNGIEVPTPLTLEEFDQVLIRAKHELQH